MSATDTRTAWQGYANTGRPDFLNYLRAGDVTWSELWDHYRAHTPESEAVLRLTGLFHIFMSQAYDDEGGVLDRDGEVFTALRDWGELALDRPDLVPEERLRDSLATLLGQSLISPLYYEAVFTLFVEASLARHVRLWTENLDQLEEPQAGARAAVERRHMAIHLDELPRAPSPQIARRWDHHVSVVIGRHYTAWDEAYALAIGDDGEAWRDEGDGG